MTNELLNKANDLSDRIKKLEDSICKVEYEIRYKKRFDEDIIKGYKPCNFKSYLKSFASVVFRKDKKPSIRGYVECHYPVEIELEDEEFCTLLLEYLNNKKSKLREELDKL
jgi:hypothetical protein